MKENEAVETLKECLPIYNNLHDKIRYILTPQEIKWLDKLKIFWDSAPDQEVEDRVIEKAGMSLYEFAFLGGCLQQLELKESRKTA